MKILFLLTEPPFPPFNGVRIKTYNLLKGLHENGHELHLLFFFDEDERYDSRVESEILKFCCTVHAVKMDNRRLRLLKNFLLNVFGKEIITFRFISAVFLEELRRSVSSVSFDVVHFDLISLTAYRQPLLGIAPLVASINDSYTLWLKNKFFNSPVLIQRGLFELLFYALSEVDKNFLLGLNPRLDVTVIPNGVDTNFYKSLVYAQHENELCFVGSMGGENAANILWFMREVFVKVKADNPNIKLIIVGKNPPVELIQQAKLVGGVDVTGFVKDIRPYIERATLIVDPTVKSCGILNHILQSMAMGKVVVGTNSSFLAIKGAVDNEHMVVARSSDDFATKIELLLRDESKRRQIGFNARCLMEKSYRWANTVSQYEKMYNAAIQKHAGGRGL
jgi:glycosyltransferase involved in cell wall biosynthesis